MAERGQIRRVVTGHDANGKAIVIEDGYAPTVRSNPLRPNHISVDIWRTSEAPIVIRGDEPDPTKGPRQIHPGPRGTVFRISEVGPESEAIRSMTPEQARDVVIQRGTNHAWSNRSGKPARMLYVLIDGDFDPALETSIKQHDQR
jgi:hypothetical protein